MSDQLLSVITIVELTACGLAAALGTVMLQGLAGRSRHENHPVDWPLREAEPRQPLRFVCYRCCKRLTAPAESADSWARCPRCGSLLRVPALTCDLAV